MYYSLFDMFLPNFIKKIDNRIYKKQGQKNIFKLHIISKNKLIVYRCYYLSIITLKMIEQKYFSDG